MVGKCRLVSEAVKNDRIEYTYGSASTAWTPIWHNSFGVLIPMESKDASVENVYYQGGRFNFHIADGVTVAKGDWVYYNTTNDDVQLTNPESAGFLLGQAVEAGTAEAGYVDVQIIAGNSQTSNQISVYDSYGKFIASYKTIDLACAALVNGYIIKLKAGEYNLTGAIDITKTDCQIIGVEPGVVINCAVGADYGFKTVFGAISSTKGITFSNMTIEHGDDATQQAIRIENTSATGRINVYINDVDFGSDGGDSIHVDHAATAAAIRLYVNGGTIEGPANFTVGNTDDRIRFESSYLAGGLVTGTSATAMEIELWKCKVLHEGVTGGASQQLLYAAYCLSATGGNPEVYAKLDTNDLAGSHTESLLYPA
jgi:hypothetical protein